MFNIHSNECFNPMNGYINSYVTLIAQTRGLQLNIAKGHFPARCRLLSGSTTRMAVAMFQAVSVCKSPVGSPGKKPAAGGCKSTLLWEQVPYFPYTEAFPLICPYISILRRFNQTNLPQTKAKPRAQSQENNFSK